MMFSAPQPTIEAAQALHTYELFNCAAVFQAGENDYRYALIREADCPPRKTAEAIKKATGYTMVAFHGPLLPVWEKYKPAQHSPRRF